MARFVRNALRIRSGGLVLGMWMRAVDTDSAIDPFFEFFAGFEKGEFFGSDGHFLTGLWVPAHITLVFLDEKTAKAPDLDAFTRCQGIGHVVEKECTTFAASALDRPASFFKAEINSSLFINPPHVHNRHRTPFFIYRENIIKSQGVTLRSKACLSMVWVFGFSGGH